MSSPDRQTFYVDPRLPPYGLGVCVCILGAGFDKYGTDRTGRIFIGRLPYEGNQWTQIHGGVDPGETPLQAAWREIEEEIGTRKVQFVVSQIRPNVRHFGPGREFQGKIEIGFLYLLNGNAEINLNAHTEIAFTDHRWIELNSLPHNIGKSRRSQYNWMTRNFAELPDVLKSMPRGSSDEDRLHAVLDILEQMPDHVQAKFSFGTPSEFPLPPKYAQQYDTSFLASLRY